MTKPFQRYAIYWMPEPESALAAFGERWFANASNGAGGSARESFGLSSDLAARATKSPARYLLHATLKAPFRLREDATETSLQSALDEFCGVRRPAIGGPLRLSRFQGYLGLVHAHASAEADWLASQCVTWFDRFRAKLDGSDRERRAPGMSGRDAEFFESFGYPYVLSAFLFHVSLAGPLSGEELDAVEKALSPHVAPLAAEPLKVESLCLLGEPVGGGIFSFISRHRFMR